MKRCGQHVALFSTPKASRLRACGKVLNWIRSASLMNRTNKPPRSPSAIHLHKKCLTYLSQTGLLRSTRGDQANSSVQGCSRVSISVYGDPRGGDSKIVKRALESLNLFWKDIREMKGWEEWINRMLGWVALIVLTAISGIKNMSCFQLAIEKFLAIFKSKSRQDVIALDLKLIETNEISITHLQL